MKRLLLIAAAGAVAVIALIFTLYSSLDGLIRTAVETFGSEATQAEVRLAGAELDAKDGRAALSGFLVGNPKGFTTPAAVRLGAMAVRLDVGSLAKDSVLIHEVAIDGPEVTYELGTAGNNFDALKRNVDAYAQRFAGSGGSASSGGGKKIVIENLYIRNGSVAVAASVLGGRSLGAKLPDIHLKDIGKESGGASPAEVAKRIMDALQGGVGKAMASIGVGATLDSLKGIAGDAAGAAAKAGEQLQEKGGALGGAVGGAIQQGTGQAGDALKNILGR